MYAGFSDGQSFTFPWTPGNKSTGLSLVMWDDDEDEGDTRDFLGKVDLPGGPSLPPTEAERPRRPDCITSPWGLARLAHICAGTASHLRRDCTSHPLGT